MLGMARQMVLAVFRDEDPTLVDKDGGVVAMGDAVFDRQFAVAEVEANPELAGEFEQGLRLRPRHITLEEAIDLRLIFDEPARKKRRQRQFRIDDEVAAIGVRLAHQGRQPPNHLRPRLTSGDWPQLARRDIHQAHYRISLDRRAPASATTLFRSTGPHG